MQKKPVRKRLGALNFKVDSSFGVLKVLRVLFLGFAHVLDASFVVLGGVGEFIARNFNVFEQNHLFESTHFHSFEGIVNTENNHLRVHGDFIVELLQHFLFLNEFDIAEAVCGKGDSLTESIVLSVGDIEKSEYLGRKTFVEFFTASQFILERGRTGEYETLAVNFVISDEVLDRHFAALADVSVTLFDSLTSESHGRLSTSSVLLG